MSEHTNGPWRYEHGDFNVGGDNPGGVGSILSDEDWYVARIEDAPEDQANARLIAAAPDMLEALLSLLDQVESSDQRRLIVDTIHKATS